MPSHGLTLKTLGFISTFYILVRVHGSACLMCARILLHTFTLLALLLLVFVDLDGKDGGGRRRGGAMNTPIFPAVPLKDVDRGHIEHHCGWNIKRPPGSVWLSVFTEGPGMHQCSSLALANLQGCLCTWQISKVINSCGHRSIIP